MNIKKIRKEKGLSQEKCAKLLNVSQTAFSRYEKNEADPTIKTLTAMAKLFQVSIDELIGYAKKNNLSSEQKAELLKTIEKLTDIECLKLNSYAQGLMINRNEETKRQIEKLEKELKGEL